MSKTENINRLAQLPSDILHLPSYKGYETKLSGKHNFLVQAPILQPSCGTVILIAVAHRWSAVVDS